MTTPDATKPDATNTQTGRDLPHDRIGLPVSPGEPMIIPRSRPAAPVPDPEPGAHPIPEIEELRRRLEV